MSDREDNNYTPVEHEVKREFGLSSFSINNRTSVLVLTIMRSILIILIPF